jgi:hypothetical protein
MNTSDITHGGLQERPACSVKVPGFPSVMAFQRYGAHEGRIGIEYRGTAEDLIACGAATVEMFAMNDASHRGPRIKRIDEHGDRFRLTRIWRSTDPHTGEACEPYRWYYVERWKPVALIRRLPGADEAIAAYAEYDGWEQAQQRVREDERRASKPAIRPKAQLRLVVDNTETAT